MTEFGSADFLDQYRFISNKLKKRFLRKPNVKEISEEFTRLGIQCENINLNSHAGLCWIASARCEGSLENLPGETGCLTRAARQFISTETRNQQLGCLSPGKDNLEAAVSCYSHAVSKYTEESPLGSCLLLELAPKLEPFSKTASQDVYDQISSTGAFSNNIRMKIILMQKTVSCKIKQGDFAGALAVLTELVSVFDVVCSESTQAHLYTKTVLECEVTQVLLILILSPVPQRLAAPLGKLLEKYTWGKFDDANVKESGIGENLFILVQSLIMSVQALDTETLPQLEGELWPHLTSEQRDLCRRLVRICLS